MIKFFRLKDFQKALFALRQPIFFEGIEGELFERCQSIAELERMVEFYSITSPAFIGHNHIIHMHRFLSSFVIVFVLICQLAVLSSCKKDDSGTPSNPASGFVTDIDGNVYQTVTIGTQVWMKENLKVSKYRNGDPIPTNLTDDAWNSTTTGAYAIYNNDVANNTTYGKLYNWYAVADSRNLCPAGWHVPSDAEWTTLENYLGDSSVAGGKLKSTSNLWNTPNTGATNESGFFGLPGGNRLVNGTYNFIGYYGDWWSSTENSTTFVWSRGLYYYYGLSYRNSGYKQGGFSVRCIRD